MKFTEYIERLDESPNMVNQYKEQIAAAKKLTRGNQRNKALEKIDKSIERSADKGTLSEKEADTLDDMMAAAY